MVVMINLMINLLILEMIVICVQDLLWNKDKLEPEKMVLVFVMMVIMILQVQLIVENVMPLVKPVFQNLLTVLNVPEIIENPLIVNVKPLFMKMLVLVKDVMKNVMNVYLLKFVLELQNVKTLIICISHFVKNPLPDIISFLIQLKPNQF